MPTDDKKKDEKKADEKKAADEKLLDDIDLDDFDKERALATIREQRKIEKAQLKELASLRKLKEEKEAAEAAEAEAQKDLETKLAEATAERDALKAEKVSDKVKADFIRVATLRGYEEPELAYLAAVDADALGAPKDGKVGDHNFDVLEERYPKLASEAGEKRGFGSGDAGRKGRKAEKTAADQFNESVRGQINH